MANRIIFTLVCGLMTAVGTAVLAQHPETLPGTKPLDDTSDLAMDNLDRVDRFLLKRIERSPETRQRLWNRDVSSPDAYRRSVKLNRDSLLRRIGAVDPRQHPRDLQLVATLNTSAVVAESPRLRIMAVRWNVFDDVDADGLLLEPIGKVCAQVVALPDADQTPEQIAGLDPTAPGGVAFARRLAEAGCRVLVPTTINRKTKWSGHPRVHMMNQTHREFIYRSAFFMGRHPIGYEVQKVLAAVDYFQNWAERTQSRLPVGVAGYGEGGLLAFYSAAIDPRVDAVWVSGYFQPREGMHREPVYRNVYGLLREFGDAEIASLIAPRPLIIEACRTPETSDLPPLIHGNNYAGYGKLTTPALDAVQSEFSRAQQYYHQLGVTEKISLVICNQGKGAPGSDSALHAFLGALGVNGALPPSSDAPLQDRRKHFAPEVRMKRQFDQLNAHTQAIVRESCFRRDEFWSDADDASVEKWQQTTRPYRDLLWDEIIGRLPKADQPPNARTRLIWQTPNWKGYEVVLDVYADVTTYGVLLLPRGLKPGERRPVVVAQHGRDGRAKGYASEPKGPLGAKLADRGFIVYAPQNLYIDEARFRRTQRKAFALGMTIFAPMVRQHEQALAWLATLPFVDAQRIAFYGKSYGGKSAMLIPAIVEGYCLSICSADFNQTVWKHTSIHDIYSFVFYLEDDHTEFDFGERFNYSEIAGLIAPRPFMVERGHRDGVAPDEWVAFEYAKVRRLYDEMGIGDRTEIEFFNGGHEIHGVGTFAFLHKHLQWPEPEFQVDR